jgi:hypothetical protein
MSKFDEFCNLIMEAYGKRVDVPYDGRTAPDRFNNPGGAYPKKGFEKYGMEGYDIIGGGHPIAKYPTLGHGIAANIAHLKSMPIVGKTVGQARHYWVNGNFNGSKPLSGMDNNQVITQELLNDPNWLAQWIKATAKDEGFNQKGRQIDDGSLNQAFAILQNKSNFEPSQAYASNSLPPSNTEVASNVLPPNNKKVASIAKAAATKADSSLHPSENETSGGSQTSQETEETMSSKMMNVVNNGSISNEEKIKQLTELGKETKIGGLAGGLLSNINSMIASLASGDFDKGSFAKNATSLVNQAKGFFAQGSNKQV